METTGKRRPWVMMVGVWVGGSQKKDNPDNLERSAQITQMLVLQRQNTRLTTMNFVYCMKMRNSENGGIYSTSRQLWFEVTVGQIRGIF